jgi:hypothetical protein
MGSYDKWGWGATGGVSLRRNFLGGDWYLDANYTYRQRISRALEELIIDEHVVFITFSRRGLFFR